MDKRISRPYSMIIISPRDKERGSVIAGTLKELVAFQRLVEIKRPHSFWIRKAER